MIGGERRAESIAKGVATRRRNAALRKQMRDEAIAEKIGLKNEIRALRQQRDSLHLANALNAASAAITGKALLIESEIVKASTPWHNLSGVYFLIKGKRVVYVGQAKSVLARIGAHKGKDFDSFAFVPCDPESLDKLESLYIHVLRPELNGNTGPMAKLAPIGLERLIDTLR